MKRQVLGICLGNLFEHYDKALFGYLSPFLAPLIFPNQDAVTALILTYAMLPLSMLARPLGVLVLGFIGYAYGRERALFYSLLGMALVSCAIAFIPTSIAWAPILFCLGRALQNFLVAGETMGGAVVMLEKVAQERRDLYSGLYSSTAMGGHLLASLGVAWVASSFGLDLGWRALYLFGGVTALFAWMIRPPCPAAPRRRASFKVVHLSDCKALLIIMVASGFARATYSMALVFVNGFIPLVSTMTKVEAVQLNTKLLLLDLCALPLFGWIASRVSRERLMFFVAATAALLAIPLLVSLQSGSLATVIAVRVVLVLIGVAFFAPFHAWVQPMVAPDRRWAVISLGYALGSQLLGSPTAAISLWLYQRSGTVASAGWYWMALAVASMVSIVVAQPLAKRAAA